MSILGDIMSVFREIDGMSVEDAIKKKRASSIAKSSASGTLQFPVICSRSLDLETMMMISKALERSFSSFAQITFTQNPMFKTNGSQSLTQYIRQFHQNTDVSFDSNDVLNSVSFVLNEGLELNGVRYDVLSVIEEGRNGRIETSNRDQMDSILNHLRYDVLNEKYTPKISMVVTKDRDISSRVNTMIMESNGPSQKTTRKPPRPQTITHVDNSGSVSRTKQTFTGDMTTTNVYNVKGGKTGDVLGNDISLPKSVLSDNEVKKSNELVPTMLRLKVMLMDKEGKNNGSVEFLLGVKAMLHPVTSDEMVSNMVSACKNNNKIFDFIRWTTGEISFLKDFILSVDEMKHDAVSKSNGSSPWWSALKRRKALAKVKNKSFLGNNLLPNSTIVMSAEEVEYIKAEYGYDLSDVRLMKKIMETYFLIGFVILDPSTEISHILFDGQMNPQSLTFDGLKRENTSSKNVDSKEVIKLMNRL